MYILLIIAALIYNEFLIINICDLSKNTKLFLDYEAENDDQESDDASDINLENVLFENNQNENNNGDELNDIIK